MSHTVQGENIEERLARLECRFEQLVGSLHPAQVERTRASSPAQVKSARRTQAIAEPAPPSRYAGPTSPSATMQRARAYAATDPTSTSARPRVPRDQPLSDVVGGRVLAWLGGVATLIGIVLFLALAISRGWIGEDARVLIAGAASCLLMAAGAWLHAHRGRTEAARTMVGTATAGLFATLVVASQVYELIPAMVAVALSVLVGSVSTILAIRWAGRVIGALGLIGALLSPVLVGAPEDAATIAVLAVACACAAAVVIRQRWPWLGLASVLVCAPQWAVWVLGHQSLGGDLLVLAAFSALGLGAAVGAQMRGDQTRLPRGSVALAALSACLAALIGYIALQRASGQPAAELWLAALAGVHGVLGACRFARVPVATPLRHLLLTAAVVLADVAFGLGASGVALAIGWAAAAVGFAWLVRRTSAHGEQEALFGLGLGAHIALALIRTLIDEPISTLGSSDSALLPLLSVSALAAACLGSAHLVGEERTAWRTPLHGLGLVAVAYLTAAAFSGPALVCAWCGEALALSRIGAGARNPVSRHGTFGFLGLAVLYALVDDAPPSALVTGVSDLGAAALALGAIAAGAFFGARLQSTEERVKIGLLGGSAAALMYLASVAIVTVFQPGAEAGTETVLDLTVRQEGQVLLSTLWSLVGLTALIIGLRRKQGTLRSIALGWLMVTVGKVFLYDLSTLTSIYRVVSFVALGLLLLAGAYAYQRLRPPPLPDMRSVHPSQR